MGKKSSQPTVFQTAYDHLNPAQRQAVDTIDGPVMVVAGPGTGKTQVLAVRIANILQSTDTPPEAILALTFTESGTRAMRQRLVDLIGPSGYYVTISTFHSFCTGVIHDHPDKFLVAEESQPLSDLERLQIFTQILDDGLFEILKPPGAPRLYLKALINAVQNLKREGYTPDTFVQFLKQQPQEDDKHQAKLEELAVAYGHYQQSLDQRSRYDYEDMINRVIRVWAEHPDILQQYQERYLYLLADEYQDTNSAQNQILLQLASFWGPQANIFVVGDDQQSIYRFQGAAVENILDFQQHFPKATIVSLQHNYRSQQTILDASYALISYNQVVLTEQLPDISRRLKSQTELKSRPIQVAEFPSPTVENFYVAQQIKQLLNQGTPAREIAILYRNNADANDIADMLGRMGIQYNLEGGDDVLTTPDVQRLLTIFRAVLALRTKEEDLDLFTLLNYPFIPADYTDVLKLLRFASDQRCNLFEALNHPQLTKAKLDNPEALQQTLDQLLRWSQLDAEHNFTQWFETVLNESGLLEWILEQPDTIRRLNRLNSLFDQVKQLNHQDHQLNLPAFLRMIALMQDNRISIPEDDLDIDTNAVRLTSAHKAKGLEFEHVFIIKAYDGKWGNKRIPELIKLPAELLTNTDTSQKEKNEDERRLFFVALTRAKQQAHITYATTYEQRQVIPSMFVEEVPDHYKQAVDTTGTLTQVKTILEDVFTPIEPHTHTPVEEEFLRSVLHNFKLNPTALNLYLTCAYKFKLQQVFRTPTAKPPAMAYGSAFHAALEDFFRLYRKQEELPSINYILDRFHQALSKEILTDTDRQAWSSRGEQAIRLYISYYQEDLQRPIVTEKFFGSRLNPVLLDDVPLTGKVDKVELLDAKNKSVRIIDYKTGRPKSKNEIEGNTKYSDGGYKRQLVFYHLLAELDRSFPFQVAEAQLDFVEANSRGKLKKESFTITAEELEDLKSQIRDTMTKIKHLEFPRTTDYRICQSCEFLRHCWPEGTPAQQPLVGEQTRLDL